MSGTPGRTPPRNGRIGARFGAAAGSYAGHARVQRGVAGELARRIAALPLPATRRILEVGCGTGFLSAALRERLAPASWTITDIAPEMVAAAERDFSRPGFALPGDARFRVMDGEYPDMDGPYDLICSSMAVQWFGDLDAGLARLSRLLAPGGWLVIATLAEGTFGEWHAAHAAHGLEAAVARYPQAERIGHSLPGMRRELAVEIRAEQHRDGLAFLRSLRAIGATAPTAEGRPPLSAGALRWVLRTFEERGASVSYQVAYGTWRKAETPRGVFEAAPASARR